MMQRLRGKLVTVTGGLGFVGRSLIRKLLEYGARVTILDHYLENSHRFVDRLFLDKVKFVHADTARLTDPGSIITETDLIYALAGRSGAADSLVHPLEDLEANCVGHLTLLEGARLYNPSVRFVYPSSRLVYGRIMSIPVRENAPLEPTSIYGVHKLAGEKYYMLYWKLYKIQSTVLRLTNPYGPLRNMGAQSFGIINQFIKKAASDSIIRIYGTGAQLRDFVFIEDVVDAMLIAGVADEAIGKVYNVGSGKGVSIADVARLITKIAGSGQVEHVPWPAFDAYVETGDFTANVDEIRRELGWGPRTGLEEGLEVSLRQYRNLEAMA